MQNMEIVHFFCFRRQLDVKVRCIQSDVTKTSVERMLVSWLTTDPTNYPVMVSRLTLEFLLLVISAHKLLVVCMVNSDLQPNQKPTNLFRFTIKTFMYVCKYLYFQNISLLNQVGNFWKKFWIIYMIVFYLHIGIFRLNFLKWMNGFD